MKAIPLRTISRISRKWNNKDVQNFSRQSFILSFSIFYKSYESYLGGQFIARLCLQDQGKIYEIYRLGLKEISRDGQDYKSELLLRDMMEFEGVFLFFVFLSILQESLSSSEELASLRIWEFFFWRDFWTSKNRVCLFWC